MGTSARRWTLVTMAAVVLTVLLSWTLPGCSFNVSCGAEEPGTGAESPVGAQTYTDADYGYSFDYPADWKLDEDSAAEIEGGVAASKGVSVHDPEGARTKTYAVDLFQVSIYELNITVDESALPEVKPQLENMIAGIGSQDPSWEILEALADAEVGGLSGFETLVTHLMDGRQVNSRLYFLFDGSTEYELMLQAATESWDAIQPDFDAILASFKPGPRLQQ
ncbi:MAG: hypothetical protein JW990_03065 [Thermoleophilia bacterium]|nr:hypothetical protein [Thermoleophilia bacterium]